MLFRKPFLEGIAEGRVTLAFRRWRRPTVKAGGTLKTAVGVLAIESVDVVEERGIRPADAKKAGFGSVEELLADLVQQEGAMLCRVRFRLAGEDPRIALREDDSLDSNALDALRTKLSRMDAAAEREGEQPWTLAYLRLIRANEAVRAGDLAVQAGEETPRFKVRVRRLKNLGLTESLGTGYRVSPRGLKLLKAAGRPAK